MIVSSELRMAELLLKILVEEDERGGGQLALLAPHVAAVAEEVDVDGTDDLRRLRETGEHVLEVVFGADAERVAKLEHEIALGGAGRPDEEERLLRHGGHRHQIDHGVFAHEVARESDAKPIDALAQGGRLLGELFVGQGVDALGSHLSASVRSRWTRRRTRCSSSSR